MGTTLSLSSTPGLPRTSLLRVRTSSLWRRWSPPLESSRTSSSRRRSWLRVCNESNNLFYSFSKDIFVAPVYFTLLILSSSIWLKKNNSEAVIIKIHKQPNIGTGADLCNLLLYHICQYKTI